MKRQLKYTRPGAQCTEWKIANYVFLPTEGKIPHKVLSVSAGVLIYMLTLSYLLSTRSQR